MLYAELGEAHRALAQLATVSVLVIALCMAWIAC